MAVTRDLTLLKSKLTILKMKTEHKLLKCPSYSEVRKAFRKVLMNHPDKGGNTQEFQAITEAYRGIMDYMTMYPDNVEKEEDEGKDTIESNEDAELRRMFNESTVKKNAQGCITFRLKQKEAERWMTNLDQYFKDLDVVRQPLPAEKNPGFFYSDPDWKIPGKDDSAGTLKISIWTTTKNPCVMFQGHHYVSFVALALPRIAMTGREVMQIENTVDKEYTDDGKKPEQDEYTDDGKKTEQEEYTDNGKKPAQEVQKEAPKVAPKDILKEAPKKPLEEVTKEATKEAPKEKKKEPEKEEQEVVLGEKEDESLKAPTKEAEKEGLKEADKSEEGQNFDFVKVCQLMKRVEKGIIERNSSIDLRLISSIELQKKTEKAVKDLEDKMKAMEEKVEAKIDSLSDGLHKKIDVVIDQVDVATTMIDSHWGSTQRMMSDIEKKVNLLQDHMKRLHDKYSQKKEAKIDEPEVVEDEVIDVKEKKTILFTSSVASNIKVDTIEKATGSKVEVVKTSKIRGNLPHMVNEKMTKDIDLVILAVGSNDIRDLDLEADKKVLIQTVINQSEDLVNIAVKIAEENNTDVFINERIPRHDEPNSDMVSELTVVANSIMISQLAVANSSRVHLVRQSNLYRAPGEARDQLYRNGNHLTEKGLLKYSNNLVNTMKKCLPEIPGVEAENIKNNGTKVNQEKSKGNKVELEVAKSPQNSSPNDLQKQQQQQLKQRQQQQQQLQRQLEQQQQQLQQQLKQQQLQQQQQQQKLQFYEQQQQQAAKKQQQQQVQQQQQLQQQGVQGPPSAPEQLMQQQLSQRPPREYQQQYYPPPPPPSSPHGGYWETPTPQAPPPVRPPAPHQYQWGPAQQSSQGRNYSQGQGGQYYYSGNY